MNNLKAIPARQKMIDLGWTKVPAMSNRTPVLEEVLENEAHEVFVIVDLEAPDRVLEIVGLL